MKEEYGYVSHQSPYACTLAPLRRIQNQACRIHLTPPFRYTNEEIQEFQQSQTKPIIIMIMHPNEKEKYMDNDNRSELKIKP